MAEKKKTYRIVEVELLKDHTHARVLRKKGEKIDVAEDIAEFLGQRGIAKATGKAK